MDDRLDVILFVDGSPWLPTKAAACSAFAGPRSSRQWPLPWGEMRRSRGPRARWGARRTGAGAGTLGGGVCCRVVISRGFFRSAAAGGVGVDPRRSALFREAPRRVMPASAADAPLPRHTVRLPSAWIISTRGGSGEALHARPRACSRVGWLAGLLDHAWLDLVEMEPSVSLARPSPAFKLAAVACLAAHAARARANRSTGSTCISCCRGAGPARRQFFPFRAATGRSYLMAAATTAANRPAISGGCPQRGIFATERRRRRLSAASQPGGAARAE
eukprot:366463-Chlamydomonas_euryale.AAC.8